MMLLVEELLYGIQKHWVHIVEKLSMRIIFATIIKQPDDSILNARLKMIKIGSFSTAKIRNKRVL